MAFSLEIYPWTCSANHRSDDQWAVIWEMKPHLGPRAERALSDSAREQILQGRNSFAHIPLVSYSSQYGISCFEA